MLLKILEFTILNNRIKLRGKLFGGTVPPNNTLFGGTVLPNSTLFDRTPHSEILYLIQ